MIIRCAYKTLMPIAELRKLFDPANENVHPKEQIDRLAKILEYQGVRSPAILDSQTGLVVVGHGRIMAADQLGWEEFPVDEQVFDSDEMRSAHRIADNAISEWSTIDLGRVNEGLPDYDPTFDLDLLGLKNFTLDPAEKKNPDPAEREREASEKVFFKLTQDQKDQLEGAIGLAKDMGPLEGDGDEKTLALMRCLELFQFQNRESGKDYD